MDYVILNKAKKTIVIWDLSWGSEHARALGLAGNKVYYYTEWVAAEPQFHKEYTVGIGIEGIEKVTDFYEYIDQADLLMFIALGHAGEVKWLRKKGYTVYGAGAGERLEMDRFWALKQHEKLGLPVSPYKEVKGVTNVIKYLESLPQPSDRIVKVNVFRGDITSFDASDLATAKISLGNMVPKLGPFSEDFEFLVQNKVHGIESGWDLWFNGHDFLKPYLWGYAGIEKYYVGKWVDEMPPVLEMVKNKIRPLLQELDYRGCISVEIIVDKNKDPYVIDWTCRFAYPLSYIFTYAIKNYTELVFACAQGKDIRIQPLFPFVCAKEFNSTLAQEEWLAINFPPSLRSQIKLSQGVRHKGQMYVSPVDDMMTGATVGGGKSWEAAVKSANKAGDKVKAADLGDKPSSASMEKIEIEIKEGVKVGLKF